MLVCWLLYVVCLAFAVSSFAIWWQILGLVQCSFTSRSHPFNKFDNLSWSHLAGPTISTRSPMSQPQTMCVLCSVWININILVYMCIVSSRRDPHICSMLAITTTSPSPNINILVVVYIFILVSRPLTYSHTYFYIRNMHFGFVFHFLCQASCGANNGFRWLGHARYCSILIW